MDSLAVPSERRADEDRATLESALLPRFLGRQRWFAGKSRAPGRVRVSRMIAGPGPAEGCRGYLLIVEVGSDGAVPDRYQVPVVAADASAAAGLPGRWVLGGSGEDVWIDGLADPEFCRGLLRTLAGAGRLGDGDGGAVVGVPTAGLPVLDDETPDPEYRAIEQSHSTVTFGDRLFLKVFRRLTPGVNPDFEIGRFLTERHPFDRVPRTWGALEYRAAGEPPTTTALLQERVASDGTGWDRALAALAGFFAEAGAVEAPSARGMTLRELLRRAAEAGPAPDELDRLIGREVGAATALGRRTAELHRALAADHDDPDFAPEPMGPDDLDASLASARARLTAALDALRGGIDRAVGPVGDDARRVLDGGPTLLASLDGGRHAARPAGQKIRIHGDYHLGQVLRRDDDFLLLDFEGEPSRPLAERRAKRTPLVDVVGMLRSFDYAAFAGLFAFAGDDRGRVEALSPAAVAWRDRSSLAFLRGYLWAIGGTALLPPDLDAWAPILEVLAMEKAAYELIYELDQRPEWVRIPLRGLLGLIPGRATPSREDRGPTHPPGRRPS